MLSATFPEALRRKLLPVEKIRSRELRFPQGPLAPAIALGQSR